MLRTLRGRNSDDSASEFPFRSRVGAPGRFRCTCFGVEDEEFERCECNVDCVFSTGLSCSDMFIDKMIYPRHQYLIIAARGGY